MTNIGAGEKKILGIRRKNRKNPEKIAQKKKKCAGIRKNPLDNGEGIVYNNMAHFNNEAYSNPRNRNMPLDRLQLRR